MSINLSAGVYAREVDQSFVVPNGSGAIGAIVVESSRGETGVFKQISNNREFVETFGKPEVDKPSMYAALAFLEKGNNLQVARVAGTGAVLATATFNATATPTLKVDALGEGTWGNSITVTVGNATGNIFDVTVKYETSVVETFTVSMVSTDKDGFGKSLYVEDVINDVSAYITATELDAANPPDAAADTALTAGADGTVTDADVNTIFNMLLNKAEYDVRYLINGGWATNTVAAVLIAIAESRKDCIAILDSENSTVFSDITDYRTSDLASDTSYAALYAPWVKAYDSYNDKTLSVPPSGYVAGIYADTQQNAEPWNAPAGSRRGTINSIVGVDIVFTEANRDTLQEAQVNPIQSYIGRGIQVDGQKTLQLNASALDRVNVRMLMINVERDIEKALNSFLFEFNDEFTRANITSIVNNYLEDVKVRRGVYEYKAVCDATNNTAVVIDGNKLILSIYLKPSRVAEYIQLNAVITQSGASFTSAT